jgi:hypothetical protein
MLIHLLIVAVVVALVVWLILWALAQLPGFPIAVFRVVAWVIYALWLLLQLLPLVSVRVP